MKTKTQQSESIDSLSKKGTCIEFFSAYQDLDIDRMISLCSPDGTVAFEPLGDAGKGKLHETGRAIWLSVIDSFPDLDNTVKSQTFNPEDNSVTCVVSIFGTQEKDFAGMPSKGLRFDSDHIFIFRFDDKGKINSLIVRWDFERFVNQLTGV